MSTKHKRSSVRSSGRGSISSGKHIDLSFSSKSELGPLQHVLPTIGPGAGADRSLGSADDDASVSKRAHEELEADYHKALAQIEWITHKLHEAEKKYEALEQLNANVSTSLNGNVITKAQKTKFPSRRRKGKRKLKVALNVTSDVAGTGRLIYNAAEKGDVVSLAPLLEEWRGDGDVLNWANPEEKDKTPLIIASKEGKVEAVRILLATDGIDTAVCDGNEDNALTSAAASGHIEIVLQLLAQPGVIANVKSTSGDRGSPYTTALRIALRNKHSDIAALLRAAGASLTAEEEKRATAEQTAAQTAQAGRLIFDAAKEGNVTALKPLLIKWWDNADVLNWTDPVDNYTALTIATISGKSEAVASLLKPINIETKLDVNKTDPTYHFTALMFAAYNGQAEIAKLLMSHPRIKTDTTCKAESGLHTGKTAYYIAKVQDKTEIMALLR